MAVQEMSQTLEKWLEDIGIVHLKKVLHNPSLSQLISEAIKNNEGKLTHDGAFGVITTPYTGRSPNDKYIVDYQDNDDLWWGEVNQRMTPENFNQFFKKITAYLNNRDLFVIDAHIGTDLDYRLSVRTITEFAWQAVATKNLFINNADEISGKPDITILVAPDLYMEPLSDGVNSKAAIAIDLKRKIILIAASKYVGEIKKSAFTIMNALLPESDVLPMHCSANVGPTGDVALYFGLSRTGKTTLSSTPERQLIGDDEHGWGKNGVFNFEGGCYAKTIRLDADQEPVIWKAANRYGSILENVHIDEQNRVPDFNDNRYTENTRSAYPLSFVDNIIPEGIATHPTNVFLLTADAFGVMPPIAKLDQESAIFFFLSGYTSKVAGTERGLSQMPKATFSTCFGEPFLPLKPSIYANLLKHKLEEHRSNIWLVNTGWTGGGYNTGYRMPLPQTRRILQWILSGEHINAVFHKDNIFEFDVPNEIEGIPTELLYPEQTWEDKEKFFSTAKRLKQDFDENYKKFA
jgi:phosphoenolpyruvate carboxykinase (ATP)